ncbi:MAG: hypothetical protein L6R39_002334 [Caloplaca ligustica]|nr:MAG: hypothetical protein L6R39_002334 [Caloplaca ligustica]
MEDSINKPWRPIPSGRVTADESRVMLLILVPLTFLLAWQLDVVQESAAFTICTWMYNDLGGSSEGSFIRNALNAAGLVTLHAGATAIALKRSGSAQLTLQSWAWLASIAAVILTTVQTQDLPDRHGDLARRRKTMPLVYGEEFTRWVTAVLVIVWSLVCPSIWHVDMFGYVVPVLVAVFLAIRIVYCRSIAADELSWKVWCGWMSLMFILPLYKVLTA